MTRLTQYCLAFSAFMLRAPARTCLRNPVLLPSCENWQPRSSCGAIALALNIALAATGCHTGGQPAKVVGAGTTGEVLAGINSERAYLPLSNIEPTPEAPQRPVTLEPLSTRAARQIEKAGELVDQQRYTEAAIELERALRYDPNHPVIHRTLAKLHWEAGNLERAKNHVAKALAENPDDAVSQYLDGRCRSKEDYLASAISAYRTALRCSDFDENAQIAALTHYHLARALEAEGYLEAALEQYAAHRQRVAALDEPPSNLELAGLAAEGGRRIHSVQSNILERLGRFGQAAEALATIVKRLPGDVELGLRYAKLLTRAKKFDEALTAVRSVPSNDPAVIDLLFEIHQSAGRPQQAIEDLRARLADHPASESLVLSLARLLERLNRLEDARQELAAFLQAHDKAFAVRERLIDMSIDASRWEDVLRLCVDGIRRNPERSEIMESKITSLSDDTQAVEALVRPDDAASDGGIKAYLRGLLALAAGNPERAEALLIRAHNAERDSLPVRVALARVYLRTNRYDAALRVAGRRVSDRPEHTRLEKILGDIYERLDDIEKAELHYKAAMQLDRGNAQAMFALAELYNRSNRRLQAQRQLRVLLESDPNHESAREKLAYTYFEDGKPDVAIEQFKELEERATSPLVVARCAALLGQVQERNPESYRRALREAIETHGADADTWVAIAESYDANEAPEEQHAAYLEAFRLDPNREDAILGLVATEQQLLQFEEAAQRLRAILPRRPNRLQWRLGLIELMRTLQDNDASLSLIDETLDRDDLDETWRRRFRFVKLDTLRQADRDDDVLAVLKDWTKEERDDREWSKQLAREYLRQDQPALAVAIYERIYQAGSQDLDELRPLVGALAAADEHNRSCQYVLDWLNDDPQNDNALFTLVRVLADAERFDDAIELIKNRLMHTFQRQGFQDLMIGVLAQAERFDDGIEFVEGLIDELHALMRLEPGGAGKRDEDLTRDEVIRRPNEPHTLDGLHQRLFELRTSLVGLLITSKDYRGAELELTDWLQETRNPTERFEYLARLATCYRLSQDEEKANEVLARMLLLRPGSITINNDLAYVWIDRGIRLDEAERMIRRSLAQAPRQAAYLDTYGWLKYKQGDFEEARKWLLRAKKARTVQDPVILDHLGDTLWRLGETKMATETWQAAVKAATEREDEELVSDDERRVRDETPAKMEDAGAGRNPAVAPTAAETPQPDDETGNTDSGE